MQRDEVNAPKAVITCLGEDSNPPLSFNPKLMVFNCFLPVLLYSYYFKKHFL